MLSLIDDLEIGEVEALTRLSLLGRVDGDVAEKIVDTASLATLEQLGFLFRENLADDFARVRVSVYPELLAEQLRDQTGLFQRRNLLSQLRTAIPQPYPGDEVDDGEDSSAMMTGDVNGAMADAYLAATIRQSVQAQLVVRVEQWKHHLRCTTLSSCSTCSSHGVLPVMR